MYSVGDEFGVGVCDVFVVAKITGVYAPPVSLGRGNVQVVQNVRSSG